MKTVRLQDDEWEILFRLASLAAKEALREVRHGKQANHGMGQGDVQRMQQQRYELLTRCVVALGEPGEVKR